VWGNFQKLSISVEGFKLLQGVIVSLKIVDVGDIDGLYNMGVTKSCMWGFLEGFEKA